MNLIDELQSAAAQWVEANGRSYSRLATLVVNDGKFFERLAGGAGCTVATFERFMRFFATPSNWPEGQLPTDLSDALRSLGMISTSALAQVS